MARTNVHGYNIFCSAPRKHCLVQFNHEWTRMNPNKITPIGLGIRVYSCPFVVNSAFP
jgi:hypothetical protein